MKDTKNTKIKRVKKRKENIWIIAKAMISRIRSGMTTRGLPRIVIGPKKKEGEMKRVLVSGAMLCAVLVGCGSGVKKWEAKITAEPNADIRREHIVKMMEEWPGKSDKAVELYAMLGRTDADPTVRSAAVRALEQSKNTKAVEPLAEVLDNEPDEFIRRDAAVALGKVRGPGAVRALLGHLRGDPDDAVRAACARSLGQYRYPGVTQGLVAALLANDFSIVYEARRSLEKLTGEKYQTSQEWQNWLDEEESRISEGGSRK